MSVISRTPGVIRCTFLQTPCNYAWIVRVNVRQPERNCLNACTTLFTSWQRGAVAILLVVFISVQCDAFDVFDIKWDVTHFWLSFKFLRIGVIDFHSYYACTCFNKYNIAVARIRDEEVVTAQNFAGINIDYLEKWIKLLSNVYRRINYNKDKIR